jgi:hypothetical protein
MSYFNYDNYDLGQFGEWLIKMWFLMHGHVVIMSEDKYDQEKDMTIDGVSAEVKTLVPTLQIKPIAFPVGVSQSRKLDSVGRVFFVRVPKFGEDFIDIYENLDRSDYYTHTWANGTKSRCYICTNQKLIGTIRDAKLARHLHNLSSSKYKGSKAA